MKKDSRTEYFYSKLRKELKNYYFRNNLLETDKNPLLMSSDELLDFVIKYNLGYFYANLANSCAVKYMGIKSKFEETNIPKDVLDILQRLMQKSSNSYLIGGCTRDIILGMRPKDYDFVTDISYEDLKELFSDCSFKETGTEFLVFNLNYKGADYEIANFRKDSETSTDGRRPDSVQIGTIEEDQNRRDFWINTIAWNPNELRITEDAIDDILAKKLRFVGTPENRLHEDYLRGWRFFRLLATKGLEPDKESLRAVRRNWDKIYSTSNAHRVMMEIEKMAGI